MNGKNIKKKKIKNCFCTKTLKNILQAVLLPGSSRLIFLASAGHAVTSCPSFFQKQLLAVTSHFYHRLSLVDFTSVPTKVAGWSSIRPPSRWERCGCAPRRTRCGWVATIAVVPSRIVTSTPTWCDIFFPHQDPNTFHVLLPFCFGMSFLGDSTCACCLSDNLSKVPRSN